MQAHCGEVKFIYKVLLTKEKGLSQSALHLGEKPQTNHKSKQDERGEQASKKLGHTEEGDGGGGREF